MATRLAGIFFHGHAGTHTQAHTRGKLGARTRPSLNEGGSPAPLVLPPRLPLCISTLSCSRGGGARALRCAPLYPRSFIVAWLTRGCDQRCLGRAVAAATSNIVALVVSFRTTVRFKCYSAWGLRFFGAGSFIKAVRAGSRAGPSRPRGFGLRPPPASAPFGRVRTRAHFRLSSSTELPRRHKQNLGSPKKTVYTMGFPLPTSAEPIFFGNPPLRFCPCRHIVFDWEFFAGALPPHPRCVFHVLCGLRPLIWLNNLKKM